MTAGLAWGRLAVAAAAWALACSAAGDRVRGPPGADGVAADLLIRAANDSNVKAAWRLIGSDRFKDAWLHARGSNGETPLEGALRAGSGVIVGLILTHPGFDQELVRREKDRRQLMRKAFEHARDSDKSRCIWAVEVMRGVATGMKRREELLVDPRLSDQEGVWYLPKPGEWRRPATLAEMGVSAPLRPRFPPSHEVELFMASPTYTNLMKHAGDTALGMGVGLKPEIAEQVWYLLVSRTLTGSAAKKAEFDGHLRSLGWNLYFSGTMVNLAVHLALIGVLARSVEIHEVLAPEEQIGGGQTVVQLTALRDVDKVLAKAWDKIGGSSFF